MVNVTELQSLAQLLGMACVDLIICKSVNINDIKTHICLSLSHILFFLEI